MRIGFYFSDFSPESGGGFTFEKEIYQSLLSYTNNCNHQFILFFNDKKPVTIPNKKIQLVQISSMKKIERLIKFFIQNFVPKSHLFNKALSQYSNIEQYIRENNIDIIVFTNPFHNPVDLPYITIVWDLQHRLQPWFPEVSNNGEWLKRENIISTHLQRSTFIITGTKVGQNELSLFYGIPKERIRILPHPTPGFVLEPKIQNTKEYIRHKFGIDRKFLFYPAQFWPHKNHANALEALKIVKNKIQEPLMLVFAGSDKGNLSYIKQMSHDLGLSNDVIFLGFINREDIIKLYQNASALLYPSFFGPENLPPLEAFALKCPVLASRVSGSDEQLKDAAFLFNPEDPDDIAMAIIALLQNPQLKSQLIETGYQKAIHWTGKEFVTELISIIDTFNQIKKCWKYEEGVYKPL